MHVGDRPYRQGMLAMGLVLGLVLGAGAVAAPAAPAAPPPADVFYQDADVIEAVLSPSGSRLAITTAKGSDRVGLAVVDLGPGGKITRAALFRDGDVRQVRWVSDERLVFGVVDMSDGSGRPNGAPGLYAVDTDGSHLRLLVRRQGTPFITSGDLDPNLLSWNHVLLSVPEPQAGKVNEEVLVAEFTTDDRHLQLPLWLNTRTGRTRDAGFNAPPDTVGWLTDGHGEARVAFTQRDGRQAAYWRAPGSKAWTQLYDSDLLSRPFNVNAVDDAGKLYVTRSEGREGDQVLARYDFATQAPEARALVVTPGFDFEGHLITDGRGAARGVRVTTDGETTVWFDARLKALQARVDAQLPGYINRIDCRRCDSDALVALVRSYSDRDPGRLLVYRAHPADGETTWTAVGHVRSGIEPAQMATTELHRIRARDGLDLPVWVTRPPVAAGPLPAVVLVHGGPWVRGRRWAWNADAQFLATRGYVVIEPEMRGSTGYGDVHFKAGFKQYGLAMQDDIADALRWAQHEGLASTKACIAGASYGGYATLMGLIKDPDLYRCGVAWVALADLDLYVSGSWWVDDDISGAARKYHLHELVGDPVKDAALIAANSPVKQAARIKAPLLLAYGEADRRVPIAHGERLRDAMRAAGHDPVWVSYAGEGHGFGVAANRIDFAKRMAAFLDQYLGPDSPP
ncbi:MAG: S9 family peptidase [Pelomonas sp.]|nr:S9 family peptidase [Roseateles sp.]